MNKMRLSNWVGISVDLFLLVVLDPCVLTRLGLFYQLVISFIEFQEPSLFCFILFYHDPGCVLIAIT